MQLLISPHPTGSLLHVQPTHITAFCMLAAQKRVDALPAREREIASRDAAVRAAEERLRQEQALLTEAKLAVEREHEEARSMVKVC
jgi:hypothetical protein